jgi:hypothetical protein
MATTDQGLGKGTAALEFPAFRLYLIARFCTVFCAEMQSVAVGWQVDSQYWLEAKPVISTPHMVKNLKRIERASFSVS